MSFLLKKKKRKKKRQNQKKKLSFKTMREVVVRGLAQPECEIRAATAGKDKQSLTLMGWDVPRGTQGGVGIRIYWCHLLYIPRQSKSKALAPAVH